MLIIKNFTNWLTESAGLVTEALPAGAKTLAKDISAATKFNKWNVSTTYPMCMFIPKWIIDNDKIGWRIEINAYMFEAKPGGAAITTRPYTEELIAAIPAADPSMKKTGQFIEGNPAPTALPSGTKVYSPAPGQMPQVTTQSNPWGLNAIPSAPSIDAYSAYDTIAKQDPEVTVDIYLGILNKSITNANAIMAAQIKSGSNIGGYTSALLKSNLPYAQALVDKVKTLAPAVPVAPVVKPG